MKALQNSLQLLSAFCGERTSWSVTELAAAFHFQKPLISKHLSCFREAGFLQQDPVTKLYSPGIRSFLLGAQFLNSSVLVRESSAELRRLTERTGQTSTLCIREGIDIVHLASVEGPHFLDVGWRVGTWLPFHATAVGKVLFAFAESRLLNAAIAGRGMRRFTKSTICDATTLKKQFAEIVQTGWADTNQESMAGLAAQAVPVFGDKQEVVAALGLIFPRHAVKASARTRQISLLHKSARRISVRLGAQVYPYGKADK
jgi:DNA-binding IclR family transcriptional regulator